MHLQIFAPDRQLATPLLHHLRRRGHDGTVALGHDLGGQHHRVRMPATATAAETIALLTELLPLPVALTYELGLDAPHLDLRPAGLCTSARVQLLGKAGPRLEATASALRDVGVRVAIKHSTKVIYGKIEYQGLEPVAVGTLAWAMGAAGVPLAVERSETLGRYAAVVHLPDAVGEVQPLPRVRIHTRDERAASELVSALRATGFGDVTVATKAAGVAHARFLVKQSLAVAPVLRAGWCVAVEATARYLFVQGIDPQSLPLQPTNPGLSWPTVPDDGQVDIALPLDAWRHAGLLPYAGSDRQRFAITVRAVEPALASEVATALAARGYRCDTGPALGETDRPAATLATADELIAEPALLARLREDLVEAGVADLAFGEEGLASVHEPGLLGRVNLSVMRASECPRPSLLKLRTLKDFNVVLHGQDRTLLRSAKQLLRDATQRSVSIRESRAPLATIQYGGAPEALVQALATELHELTGQEFELDCCWPSPDNDIFVHFADTEVTQQPRNLSDPFGESWGRPVRRSLGFIEVWADRVRIGGTVLPRHPGPRSPLAPPAALAGQLCLDAQTAELLEQLAAAVAAGEPCLVEGPTSATKTSGVLMLAALLGQPVLRVNLSSQVDTSELMGQYVPRPDGGFAWQDGSAVRAATQGAWLVLDELNLGPPQVVERLNPLLERGATLTLSERDHRVLGGPEHPLHPDFRLFATMNPVEYAGRSLLSPAGKDRWTRQIQVQAPTSTAIEAMLSHALTGTQPPVGTWGPAFVDHTCLLDLPAPPPLPDDPGELLPKFCGQLAQLHTRVLADAGGLGSERREPYTFTRRGLLALLERLRSEVAAGEELETAMRIGLRQAYVDRVELADRPAMGLLMDAVGLGPQVWTLGAAAEPTHGVGTRLREALSSLPDMPLDDELDRFLKELDDLDDADVPECEIEVEGSPTVYAAAGATPRGGRHV